MRKYVAHFLSKEQLDTYWSLAEPFLYAGLLVSEGELDIKQLRLLAILGKVQILLIMDMEDMVRGAMATEIVSYPNFKALNIVSYGGYNLFASEEDFNYLKDELRKAGFSQLQGWCKPAQARLFKSRYGFSTPYEMIRMSLT
jgi:hypothetical protein